MFSLVAPTVRCLAYVGGIYVGSVIADKVQKFSNAVTFRLAANRELAKINETIALCNAFLDEIGDDPSGDIPEKAAANWRHVMDATNTALSLHREKAADIERELAMLKTGVSIHLYRGKDCDRLFAVL